MRFYGLKTCDTCRKALKALQGAGFEPVYVDVRADGIAAADLARFYQAFGSDLLNTRSTTWRGLDEAERGRDPLDLLAAHPTLMKRPVIEAEGVLTLGWTKAVQEKYLSAS
ncbi:arsenate reductase family protein [Neptunicoccus sediminis]|uniref:arsenate reductase family protein n=1 Tax=Neptunicoccus sediminis TaxID=1892596 RepID=UPI000845BD08|nr:ArsC/Spx/MgsR family protein [Neptunicoccus sediminis]